MRSFVVVVFSILVGCGGATQTDLFNKDASTDDGAAGADGSTNDSGGGPDARSDAPAPGDCKALIAKVNDLRTKATKCESSGGTAFCNLQVEDFCCPLTVTGPATQSDIAAFFAAVKAAKAANCAVACPAVPCSSQPSLKCSNGACQQF
jgi:hypothetical protein